MKRSGEKGGVMAAKGDYVSVPLTLLLLALLSCSVCAAHADIIKDNGDAGTSYTGTWNDSVATGCYGSESLWSRDGATYTWTFTPTASGSHAVSMWWASYPSRSSNIPVDIQYGGGSARVYINQQQNGGKWNTLGVYAFESGESYAVTITARPGPASTCADAVKIAPVDGYIPPAITSTPSTEAGVNALYTYDVNAWGYPAPSFNFGVTPPPGMTIDPVSGVIQWTPDTVGIYEITTEAYNAAGADQQSFEITVTDLSSLEPDWTPISDSPFNLIEPDGITNPVLTAADVTDAVCQYVADPFLFHENGDWYMFFEAYVPDERKGVIALARSTDGLNWTYDRIVLRNPWHNSYPLVFKSFGKYYMVPESHTEEAVYLYEALDFPYSWTAVATLARGRTFVDPSIFRYNETWWMFLGDDTHSAAYLFYADSLPGEWKEHPKSPFITGDSSRARPGGRSFVFDNDRIIRIAQKDNILYGEEVRAFQVDVLTRTDYAEHEIPESPILSPTGSGWNGVGLHQFDPWWDGDHWIVAADGQRSIDDWSIGIYTAGTLAPVITSVPVTAAVIGIPYTYDVNATGNPAPVYSLTGVPPDGMTIDATAGVIRWTPVELGSYNISVRASNGVGSAAKQNFTVTVSGIAPRIVSSPVTEVPAGQLYTYDVNATGNPAPAYSLTGTPPGGMTIDATTGLIRWTPALPGSYPVTVRASNGVGSAAQQSFTIVVAVPPPTCVEGPIWLGDMHYETSIQAAYESLSDTATMMVTSCTMDETLDLSRNAFEVTISGGYDCEFKTRSGVTTVRGSISIGSGTVILDDLSIE